jgi:hypothetical protein
MSDFRDQAVKRPVTDAEWDLNTQLAESELAELAKDPAVLVVLKTIANFWKFWYLVCGHKRLGRIMIKYASK